MAVQNDYRVRGYSVSDREPVAILSLSYDHPSGFYLSGTAIGSLAFSGARLPLGTIEEVGYARRLAPTLSIDGGVTRSDFSQLYGYRAHYGYTQAYVGLIGKFVSGHVYYSPDYYRRGVSTLYGEVDGTIEWVAKVRLNAHLGYLDYLHAPSAYGPEQDQYDWRIGASRPFGPFDVHAAVTGGGPGPDYDYGRLRSKTALVVGASWTF